MDYIYTTKGQSSREKNGTMYNGGGLGVSGSKVLSRLSRVFKGVPKSLKTFQRVQRHFEGFKEVLKGSGTFQEISGTSKRFQRGVP